MKKFFAHDIGEVTLTDERYRHIIERHPEIKTHLRFLTETLADPETVRKSQYDPDVLLFYRRVPRELYFVVVIKVTRHFILTAYLTDHIAHQQKL